MISKNFLLSSLLHLAIVIGLVALIFHGKTPPAYQAFELQLDSVHVHHYHQPASQKKQHPVEPDSISHQAKADKVEQRAETTAHDSVDSKPSSGKAQPANEISRYLAQMIQIINRQKFYPHLSHLNEEAGLVEVKVILNASGHIEQAEIKKGSGFERLDAAALKTLRSISSFPPLPAELAPSLTLVVPINYEVDPDH